VQSPTKHRWYAVKVLAMFWLMAQQRCAYASALAHLSSTRYMAQVAENLGASAQQVVEKALAEMVAKGQLILADGQLAVA
jgi:ABC-type phosphate/phosphonate transport system ATPase subunit